MIIKETKKLIISLTDKETSTLIETQNILDELFQKLDEYNSSEEKELPLVVELVNLRIRLGIIQEYIEELNPLLDENHAIHIDRP